MLHILILEDEPALARLLTDALTRSGYAVATYADGREGLRAAQAAPPDLLLADVMLPGLDGFAVVRELRRTLPDLPVLFLTARGAPADVVRGFEAGGNDYLKKPFSLDELLLRVRELLRRQAPTPPPPAEAIGLGQFEFRPLRQELWLAGQCVAQLSARENDLLLLLAQHRNGVLDRRACLRQLWGNDDFFAARSMDVYVSRLRKRLAQDPSLEILNIRGVGFKLIT
ncbi:response regulator transcription factor [Hymenobacter psoromatis]|uniref:response regulator transcription factor n=1 Tax=Hymenobacter psoromatis TaxID=1484116 RepID=UPI001CBC8189|nr:response regulator transcription factor [Hymenobacter psoromatis]